MKQIIYVACDHGIDGREPESIRFASLDEKERDEWIANSPNKPWLSPSDRIHDLKDVAEKTWKMLNGVQKLALLQTDCPMWQDGYDKDNLTKQKF